MASPHIERVQVELRKAKSIRELWDVYQQMILPEDAGPTQVSECRRAFYSGADAIFALIINQVSEGPEVREEDEVMMGKLAGELQAFSEEIAKGDA